MKEELSKYLKKIKTFTLKEIVASVVVVFILFVIVYVTAYENGRNSEINKQAVATVAETISKQDTQIEENNNELSELQSQIKNAKTELSEQQDLLNAFNDYKANKESKDAELVQLDNNIQEKSNNISSLDEQISAKTAELDKLKSAIQRTGEEPKVLTAGEYTVGKDIDAGRYIVTGKSNFVVRSALGSLKVNTILGGGSFGEESYTCTLEDGDTLELSSKDTFTPIK